MPVAIALAFAATSVAHAQGGVAAPQPPQIDTVDCLAETPCAGTRVLRGLELVVRGARLDAARRVVFRGGRGRRDDTRAQVSRGGSDYAVATVPTTARTGPLVLLDRRGEPVASLPRVHVRNPPRAVRQTAPAQRRFFFGRRKPSFSFDVTEPSPVQVDLVNEESDKLVRSWTVQPNGGRATVRWAGRFGSDPAPTGRYRFRVAGPHAAASSAGTSFFFADHVFPIRGRHNFGYGPTNAFGGGGRRTHNGHDMFARCATTVRAARGGRVQSAGYESAAGNYIVIDGAGTATDYVYMHLRRRPALRRGARVFTGQRIGQVGQTGRATGCHLHFELWSGPGWYEGGRPFDPLPQLKRWAAYS